jgi:hypothetical protein
MVAVCASCRVDATSGEGWWCYGCGRGGTVDDLASLLDHGVWGRSLRGEAFASVRPRVLEALGFDA